MKRIGEGSSCSSKSEVTGELVYIKVIEDVIKLFDKAAGKICLVEDAGSGTAGCPSTWQSVPCLSCLDCHAAQA